MSKDTIDLNQNSNSFQWSNLVIKYSHLLEKRLLNTSVFVFRTHPKKSKSQTGKMIPNSLPKKFIKCMQISSAKLPFLPQLNLKMMVLTLLSKLIKSFLQSIYSHQMQNQPVFHDKFPLNLKHVFMTILN